MRRFRVSITVLSYLHNPEKSFRLPFRQRMLIQEWVYDNKVFGYEKIEWAEDRSPSKNLCAVLGIYDTIGEITIPE